MKVFFTSAQHISTLTPNKLYTVIKGPNSDGLAYILDDDYDHRLIDLSDDGCGYIDDNKWTIAGPAHGVFNSQQEALDYLEEQNTGYVYFNPDDMSVIIDCEVGINELKAILYLLETGYKSEG